MSIFSHFIRSREKGVGVFNSKSGNFGLYTRRRDCPYRKDTESWSGEGASVSSSESSANKGCQEVWRFTFTFKCQKKGQNQIQAEDLVFCGAEERNQFR